MDRYISQFRKRIFISMVEVTMLIMLISAGCTAIVARINQKTEFEYDLETTDFICGLIEARLDEGLDDPFRYVNMFNDVLPGVNGYSYALVNKETGEVVAPEKVDPVFSTLDFSGSEDRTLVFKYNALKYFSMYSDFAHHPYRLVMVVSYRYTFYLSHRTSAVFLGVILLLLLVMLTVFWKILMKRLENTVFAKHQADLELSRASSLQRMAVTSDFPKDPRCDIFGVISPAREVGGDLYACVQNGDDLFFMIGDVSDKGLQAAFVMFLLSNVAYPMFKNGTALSSQGRALNNILCDNKNYDMFCTAIVGKLNLTSGRLDLINAGHTRMLVDGEFFPATPNMPFGVVRDYPYVTDSLTLAPGSTIVLYTDGVTDERSSTGEFFGESGILEWWGSEGVNADVEGMCKGLLAKAGAWNGVAEQSDDIAILTIKLK